MFFDVHSIALLPKKEYFLWPDTGSLTHFLITLTKSSCLDIVRPLLRQV